MLAATRQAVLDQFVGAQPQSRTARHVVMPVLTRMQFFHGALWIVDRSSVPLPDSLDSYSLPLVAKGTDRSRCAQYFDGPVPLAHDDAGGHKDVGTRWPTS